jgi:UDP-N-acetylglucosamine transferase subunit ALG13
MIVVTVGSAPGNYSFHRLIRAVDEAVARNGWEVWMQIGSSTYRPRASHARFVSQKELEDKIRHCDLMVGHCGVGTLLLARGLRKNLCVLPRNPEFGEHLDGHQFELSRELAQIPWITVLTLETLESQIRDALANPRPFDLTEERALNSELAARISEFFSLS